MRIATLGLCAVIGLGMFAIGCDQQTETPKVDAAKEAADKAAAAASNAEDAAKSAADSAAAAAKEAADKSAVSVDAAKDQAAAAVDSAKAVSADMMANVQKLYDDAKAALSKMPPDLESANGYVDQLKGLSDKLPAEWKTKIDELAKMVSDAKAKMQNVPSMPK